MATTELEVEAIPESAEDLRAAIESTTAAMVPLTERLNAAYDAYRDRRRELDPLQRRLAVLEKALTERVQGPPLHFQTIAAALRRGGHLQATYSDSGFRVAKYYSADGRDKDRAVTVTAVLGYRRDHTLLDREITLSMLDGYIATLKLEGYAVTRSGRSLVVRRKPLE